METGQRVLFANEAFYQAFAMGDFLTMDSLWSTQHPLICIHPGHAPLLKREEIMESWKAILEQGGTQGITCLEPQASVYGSTALVVCYETLGGNHLIATNGFVEEEGNWLMVHHQAGPTVGRPTPEESSQQSRVLN